MHGYIAYRKKSGIRLINQRILFQGPFTPPIPMAEKRTKWHFYYEASAPKAIDPAKTSKIDALPAESSHSRTIGQED